MIPWINLLPRRVLALNKCKFEDILNGLPW